MFSQLLLLLKGIFIEMVHLPLALIEYVRGWLRYRKLVNRFPGPPTLPLVGNLFDRGYFPNPWNLISWVLEDVMYRYSAGKIMIGPVPVILLSDVTDIQDFLMNSKNHSRPHVIADALSYCLGKGLGMLHGDEWSRHHQMLQPSFNRNLLKTYVPVFDRKGNVFIKVLSEYADGRAFDIQRMTETLKMDIVLETLHGVPSNQQLNPDRDVFNFILTGRKEFSQRTIRPWLYIKKLYDISSSGRKALDSLNWGRRFIETIVQQRKELLCTEAESSLRNAKHNMRLDSPGVAPTSDSDEESNKSQNRLLIDALLQESGKSITYESVIDELLTFLIAGFDPSAITLQFALYFLAQNPHVQEKAAKELQDIFHAVGSTEVTPDTLQRMQYVEMIVNETLRIHPPLFFFVKHAGVDTPLTSCNLTVPAGAVVMISPKTVHMNPKLYPDSHVFDPERFSPENCAKRNPFAFIPFGAGIRSCIGRKYAMLELKTVISKVIWNYHLQPDESYEPQLLWGISTTTSNGIRIKLRKRSIY